MKKTIRLTENDLHKIIRNSVAKILKEEYGVAPNGRQINQQQAIQAANKPTNWEVYQALDSNFKRKYPGYVNKYGKMAQNAADKQMGFYKRGDTTSEYVDPNLKTGNVEYMQDNLDQIQDTEKDYASAFFSDKRNARMGFKNVKNPNYKGIYYPYSFGSKNPSDYKKPSPEATDAFNNTYDRMSNYANGNWAKRMHQKGKQLGNQGIYESRKKIRH